MRLEEPDRIPLTLFLGFNPFDLHNLPADSKLRMLAKMERDQCDPMIPGTFRETRSFFYSAYPVNMKTETRVEAGMEVTTTVVETPKGPLSEVSRRPLSVTWSGRRSKAFVENDEELERFLSIPYVPVKPDTGPFRSLVKRIGERGLVHSGVAEPIRLVWSLMDQRALTLRYFQDRDSLLSLEELLFQRVRDYLDHALENGVEHFFVSGPEFVAPPLFGPGQFAEMVVRYETDIAKLVHEHGGLAWVHCHGFVNRVLDHFASTGMDGIHPIDTPPIGDTPLKEAKRRLGHRMCIVGGIQIGELYTDPRSKMEERTRNAIRDCGPDGFVLCPSAGPYTPVPAAVLEKYQAIVDGVTRRAGNL